MSDTLARIVAGLALVGLLFTSVLAWRASSRVAALDARVAQLEEQRATTADFLRGVTKTQPGRVVTPAPTRKKAKTKGKVKGKAKGKRKARLPDDVLEARRAARKERRREKVMALMNEEVGEFAADHGLDDSTRDAVVEEMLLLREAGVLIREDMREDRLTAFEGRAELKALREDSDARLVEILGADVADALRERFADEREARRSD